LSGQSSPRDALCRPTETRGEPVFGPPSRRRLLPLVGEGDVDGFEALVPLGDRGIRVGALIGAGGIDVSVNGVSRARGCRCSVRTTLISALTTTPRAVQEDPREQTEHHGEHPVGDAGVLDDVRHVPRAEHLKQLSDDGGDDGARRDVAHAELGGRGEAEGDDEDGCVDDHCCERHDECDASSEEGAVGHGAAAERRQDVVARTAMPAVPISNRLRIRAFAGLVSGGAEPTRRRSSRSGTPERCRGPVERDQATDDQSGSAALETLRVAQLVADNRELAERRVEHPLLEIAVVLEHEAEHGRQRSSRGKRDRKP
jgi:hypothetical protein